MLSQIILNDNPPARAAVVTSARATTWPEMRELAQAIVNAYPKMGKRRVGMSFPPTAQSYAALAALDRLSSDVFLFDSHLSFEETRRRAIRLRLGALLVAPENGDPSALSVHELPDEAQWSGTGTVTILTSGSTGAPKAATHTWQSLCRPVREDWKCPAPRWLLTYRPNLYAGLQVMLQCFTNSGTLVAVEPEMAPQAVTQLIYDTGVEFVSATPSFWRRLLMFSDRDFLRSLHISQITLGGEVVDQPILDMLRLHFPKARLVHIYATTELGRCFSVNDGLAGFPVSFLNTVLPDQVELKVQEQELLVRSPNAMRKYDRYSDARLDAGDWFATGDLVEQSSDRVFFVGRTSEMINVAGNKVYPIEVEQTIRTVPGVSDVRVYGKSSSIAGELVACDIVVDPKQNPQKVKENVLQVCRTQLASHQLPRLLKVVEHIDISLAGKTLRTKTYD